MDQYRLGSFVLRLGPPPELLDAQNSVLGISDSYVRILEALLRKPGETLTVEELVQKVWGYTVDRSSVHTGISQLRRFLPKEWIINEREAGYKYVGPWQRMGVMPLTLELHASGSTSRDPVLAMIGGRNLVCNIGESWSVLCRPSDDCYITLFLEGTTKSVYRLYLSATDQQSFARGGKTYRIPPLGDDFSFKENGPPGTETVWGVATRSPIAVNLAQGARDRYIGVSSQQELTAVKQALTKLNQKDWAAADCTIIVTETPL
jgi:DNA-binding winged helix-turn-helix (wHTH) protein